MSSFSFTPPILTIKKFVVDLAQDAGSYDICTADADILISSVAFFVTENAATLTSITIQTDNATSDALLASTAAGAITAGKNLAPAQTPFVLATDKNITVTITGNGTAGSIDMYVSYYPAFGTISAAA